MFTYLSTQLLRACSLFIIPVGALNLNPYNPYNIQIEVAEIERRLEANVLLHSDIAHVNSLTIVVSLIQIEAPVGS